MTYELVATLLSCVISSLMGNELAHGNKKIERSRYGKIALGAVTGFAGFLLVLMFRRFSSLEGFAMYGSAVVISAIYSYFMADAKSFEGIR